MELSLAASRRDTLTLLGLKKVRIYVHTLGSSSDFRLGWAPSTFISSRTDRAKQKAARPEDFMDEEDLAELKEGQGIMDTTEEMDLTGGTSAELNKRSGAKDSEQEYVRSRRSPLVRLITVLTAPWLPHWRQPCFPHPATLSGRVY
jgi:hypothetical protein